MSDHAPAEATQPILAVFPMRPEDRLRLALRRLDAAVADQNQAAASLREAIGDLSGTVAKLGDGVAQYRVALDSAAAEIERALASARALKATADRMAV